MKGSTVIWEKSTTPVVTPDYLYVQNTSSGTNNITLTKDDTSANTKTLEYSKDLLNWTSFTPTDSVFTVSLNQGEKLYLRGSNGTRPNLEIWGQRSHIAGGNVNTLLDYTNPNGVSLPQEAFKSLFGGDLYLTDASNLVLPATRLSNYCYSYMFYTCSSLTTTPTLSATTLAPHCYDNMFGGCSSLTTAPTLPATTLVDNCYAQMFYHSTSLTTAPELPATTLAQECYSNMFNGCSSLNSVTTFANDISASDCLDNWLGNVAATGTFNNNGSATYVKNSASGIPTGWTEVKPSTGPDYLYLENTYSGSNTVSVQQKLSGSPDSSTYAHNIQYSKDKTNWTTITLSSTAYTISLNQGEKVYIRGNEGVFNYWYSGGSQKAITTISASQNHTVGGNINTLLDYTDPNGLTLPQGAFNSMFENDTHLTSASNITLSPSSDGSLSTYCYLYMFKGCSGLTTAPQSISATTQGQDACNGMFQNCSSLTTAPALGATTLAPSCYWGLFQGCTALVNAPALPATTMKDNCYRNLFYGCSSLVNAPALPATTLSPNCYRNMFNGCTSLTTAPDLLAPTLVSYCYSYMFNACTSLNSVKCTATSGVGSNNSTIEWLWNVPSTGTFTKKSGVTWESGISGIPSNWTIVNS